jgi:signal transduction histidine kinase
MQTELSSGRESGRTGVLLRTVDGGNRHQLTNWFVDQEPYEIVEADIQTGKFDCCILDWATLLDNHNAIATRKRAERIPLPFVLLVPEQRADKIVRTLQNDARDLHSLVDELLRVPLSYLELEQRLESVLRARHQAVVLQEEHEQLALLNRMLRHDIRNEMQLILGWTESLGSHIDGDGEEMLNQALTSGRHVVELTDVAKNILDAILEREDISLEPIELGTLLETVIEARRETFDQATIRMEGQPPAVTIEANEMLSAIFRNLINNAVQHNNADEPRVTISSQIDDESVRIRIADNGPGISDDQRDQIFDSDQKGLGSQGTGMGLYLIANLVDMYDGSVWIEDNEPRGAVFVVELHTIDPLQW